MNVTDHGVPFLKGISKDYCNRDYPLKSRPFTIGRSSASDLVLQEKTVSATHARICVEEGSWILKDLESTNGTYVNGRRILRKQLSAGDTVVFDTVEFRFMLPENPEEDAPVPQIMEDPKAAGGSSDTRELKTRAAKTGFLKKAVAYIAALAAAWCTGFAGLILTGPGFVNQSHTLAQLLRETALIYPVLHLYPAWTLDISIREKVFSLGFLGLALFAGGLVFRRLSKTGVWRSAFLFSSGYCLVVCGFQFVLLDFNVYFWLRSFPAVIPGSFSVTVNGLAGILHFWAVCCLFSLFGALAGSRKSKKY